MEDETENFLDELARDLQNNPPCQTQSTQITNTQPIDISSQDDLEKYVNDNTQKSNDILFQVISQFAKDIGDDPERAEAFAKLLKSNTDLLKLLNTRLIKEKEMKNKLAIQKIKENGESMNKVIESQKSIIMNRDEIFKEILKEKKVDVIENEDD